MLFITVKSCSCLGVLCTPGLNQSLAKVKCHSQGHNAVPPVGPEKNLNVNCVSFLVFQFKHDCVLGVKEPSHLGSHSKMFWIRNKRKICFQLHIYGGLSNHI